MPRRYYIVVVFDCLKDAGEPWGMRRGVSGLIRLNLTRLQTPFFIGTTTIIPLLIPRVVFVFKDCVGPADIFASSQKSALFDNACVLKTDPCQPNKTLTTHKHEQ